MTLIKYPTPVSSEKRLQTIENKRQDSGKTVQRDPWDLPSRPSRGRRRPRGREGMEGKVVGVVHPGGDRKSAEVIEGRGDGGFPLRKRVRNRMKTRGLYVCDRRERRE
jgi:hypothetical protein